MEVNNEPHQYQWIVNEGLLRDEGTLYGIAGAGLLEKTEAIRDYYRIRKAASRTKQEHLKEQIEELIKLSISSHKDSTDTPSNLIPILLQLILYAAICYFNYWLVSYWLSPAIQSVPIFLGLYLFGLFSVFIGRSVMYNAAQSLTEEIAPAEKREKWKIYLEEIGVPLIVSLFIATLPARFYPIEFTIVAVPLFFMLFLLGGKGLINTLFRSRKELARSFQYFRQKKERKKKKLELQTLQKDLESTDAALEELNGEEEYKIKVFASEYKLAFESRQLANGVPMKKLA